VDIYCARSPHQIIRKVNIPHRSYCAIPSQLPAVLFPNAFYLYIRYVRFTGRNTRLDFHGQLGRGPGYAGRVLRVSDAEIAGQSRGYAPDTCSPIRGNRVSGLRVGRMRRNRFNQRREASAQNRPPAVRLLYRCVACGVRTVEAASATSCTAARRCRTGTSAPNRRTGSCTRPRGCRGAHGAPSAPYRAPRPGASPGGAPSPARGSTPGDAGRDRTAARTDDPLTAPRSSEGKVRGCDRDAGNQASGRRSLAPPRHLLARSRLPAIRAGRREYHPPRPGAAAFNLPDDKNNWFGHSAPR
jgi:hypothetical protein